MRFHPRAPHGVASRRLRDKRNALAWNGLVEIHHVVPRSLHWHPTLQRFHYDVHAPYNTIFMPTSAARSVVPLRADRPTHDGGHMAYNAFVCDRLDACAHPEHLLCLLVVLHRGCRGFLAIPWKRRAGR